jgi:hypothetical protein
MAAHPLTKLAVGLGLSVAIAASSQAALAFTETKVPPPPVGQAAPEASPSTQLQLQKPEDGNGLALTSPGDAKTGETELNIPGIGSVGSVPKLDFGLELLYGASGQSTEKPLEDNNDDVLIKGTIKHRF